MGGEYSRGGAPSAVCGVLGGMLVICRFVAVAFCSVMPQASAAQGPAVLRLFWRERAEYGACWVCARLKPIHESDESA